MLIEYTDLGFVEVPEVHILEDAHSPHLLLSFAKNILVEAVTRANGNATEERSVVLQILHITIHFRHDKLEDILEVQSCGVQIIDTIQQSYRIDFASINRPVPCIPGSEMLHMCQPYLYKSGSIQSDTVHEAQEPFLEENKVAIY